MPYRRARSTRPRSSTLARRAGTGSLDRGHRSRSSGYGSGSPGKPWAPLASRSCQWRWRWARRRSRRARPARSPGRQLATPPRSVAARSALRSCSARPARRASSRHPRRSPETTQCRANLAGGVATRSRRPRSRSPCLTRLVARPGASDDDAPEARRADAKDVAARRRQAAARERQPKQRWNGRVSAREVLQGSRPAVFSCMSPRAANPAKRS